MKKKMSRNGNSTIEFRGLSKKIFSDSVKNNDRKHSTFANFNFCSVYLHLYLHYFLLFFFKLFWISSGLFSVTDSTMLSVSESCLSKYVSTTYFLGQDSLMTCP